ncbi:MAG: 50S ribosomal protein L35 [Phycisphaerae bacterium]|nr:50S ribosomal protein L35 [Phycisphaerae bacterium]
MPKQKTHKGTAKRVKVTGRGKVVRKQSFRGHLMSGKSGDRKRQMRGTIVLPKADAKRAREALGLG